MMDTKVSNEVTGYSTKDMGDAIAEAVQRVDGAPYSVIETRGSHGEQGQERSYEVTLASKQE